MPSIGQRPDVSIAVRNANKFEDRARFIIEKKFGVKLPKREVRISPELTKKFDLVSEDNEWIGDIKYYKMIKVPAAKYSTIAEYVWLLQKTKASHKFIVFGHDKELPIKWFKKYKNLLEDVTFWFIEEDGTMKNISDLTLS